MFTVQMIFDLKKKYAYHPYDIILEERNVSMVIKKIIMLITVALVNSEMLQNITRKKSNQ